MHRLPSLLLACVVLVGCIATTEEPIRPPASAPSRTPAVDPTATVAAPSPTFVGETPVGSAAPLPQTVAIAPSITPEACLIRVPPGPGDAAPTEGDLTDWSHTWGGRARLCIGGDVPAEFEGTAWCQWSPRFDRVLDAAILPLPVDAATGDIDAGVSLEMGAAYVSGTSPAGIIASWDGVLADDDVRSHDRGRRGIARFSVQALPPDPENLPPVLPPDVVGLFRWTCVEPDPS